MRLSKLTWTGIVMLAVGAAVSGWWAVWVESRSTVPVDMPVSLKPGHVRTREFTVNLDRPYIISLVTKKKIPFDELNCLLGVSTDPGNVLGKKCGKPSVVNARWILTSRGRIIAEGSSGGPTGSGGWGNETVERDLGVFEGENGRHYSLDVKFLADGSALATTDPHLKVEVTAAFYEDAMWASLRRFWSSALVGALGVVLLAASGCRLMWRRKKIGGRQGDGGAEGPVMG
jgi:hypothetical protein